MDRARIPVTTAALGAVLAAVSAVSIASCGASAREIRKAKASGYATDFSHVFAEALAAVRSLYPKLDSNARAGTIKTAWHPVAVNAPAGSDGLSQQPGSSLGEPSQNPRASRGMTLRRTRYWARFDIQVTGGRPWQVQVRGQAAEGEGGEAATRPMRSASTPPWLAARIDALHLAIYKRLLAHAVRLPEERRAAAADQRGAAERDQNRFGPIPEAAAIQVAQIHDAARSRDFSRLRASMAEKFTWSFGAAPGADQAVILWQADSSILDELVKVLESGCRVSAATLVTCPSAAGDPGGDYKGYRAGFERRGARWIMTFFVEGD